MCGDGGPATVNGSLCRPDYRLHAKGLPWDPQYKTPETREAPPIAVSAVRFGPGSDFGFRKPFPFFDLLASRSETYWPKFGIGSVVLGVR